MPTVPVQKYYSLTVVERGFMVYSLLKGRIPAYSLHLWAILHNQFLLLAKFRFRVAVPLITSSALWKMKLSASNNIS